MNRIITVSSREAAHRQVSGRKLVFSYALPEAVTFDEPHVVRLILCLPASRPGYEVFIQPDFVVPHLVDGKYEPWIGVTSWVDFATWVALQNNEIPATGLITVTLVRGNNIGANTNFTLGFEIAPLSRITYGAAR